MSNTTELHVQHWPKGNAYWLELYQGDDLFTESLADSSTRIDARFAYTSLVVGLVVFLIMASNWLVGGSRADQVIQYSMLANKLDVDIQLRHS